MNQLQEKMVTIKQAADMLNVSKGTISNYIDTGKLHAIKQKVKMVFEAEVNELKHFFKIKNLFGDMVLEEGDALRPFDCFNTIRRGNISLFNPLKWKTSQRYMVSFYGHVYNMERNSELAQCRAAHGYLQVALAQYGGTYYTSVHRLVALVWCDNAKGKSEVHHIDGNKENNRADNLIWLTSKEHKYADRLLSMAKATGKYDEYNAYILEMKNDNHCLEQLHYVLDSYNNNTSDFLCITDAAYKDIQTGKYDINHIPLSEIRGEFVVPNSCKE